MATTRLIAMHQNKGRTVAECLSLRIDYITNPEKTEGGKHLTSYECDPKTAAGEFTLSKRIYEDITGRTQNSNVVAYQIRQAFKPGEIDPQQANKIGYELGMRFTKGKYPFLVATHTDKDHIHNHIVFNSTSLDCSKKFRDFKRSGKALAKLSDLICLENQLSIIENPKPSKGHYGKWLGDEKPLTYSEKLRQTIDTILYQKPTTFDEFLQLMQGAGYEIKTGKYYGFKSAEQKKFIRLRSLGEGYSEAEITAVIRGEVHQKAPTKAKPKERKAGNLIVDIQQKMALGKSKGYEHWANIYNVKQMAKTINFLTENKLLSYPKLEEKATECTATFEKLSSEIKTAEKRMAEIKVLQSHIANYAKTREIYIEYRKSGYSKNFFEEHRAELTLHKAAKTAFSELAVKKLPTMKSLLEEYKELLSDKKGIYPQYQTARKEMQDILIAKENIDRFLELDKDKKAQEKSQNQRR